MATDPELRTHQEWMGFLQPVGLVVSPPALVAAQAYVNRNVAREQQSLAAVVTRVRVAPPSDGAPVETFALGDFPAFTREVLGWQPSDLLNGPGQLSLPEELSVALPEYGDTLKPTYAVPDPDQPGRFLLLVELLAPGTDLDRDPPAEGRRWQASPQVRFERLLRETGVPIGILSNGTHLRLVYRPPGESSGHLTFPVGPMLETAGRPILGALGMLLGSERLFTLPPDQRLPHILRESRKYQNEVSTRLAEQVLGALNDLLRGFQAADDATNGALLRDVLREARGEVYGGLLTVLLRLVFILYAEDRGLLAGDALYQESYALTGLFAELREDDARHHDTLEQRYGAWARLLVVFRLIHDGAAHGSFRMPARYGRLFDPDVYPFLEGRPHHSLRQRGERLEVPKVSDGVVYRVLDQLLMLGGERLSYRALDVEQIGSVYEAMMGFTLETAAAPSIAVRPEHVVVDLGALVKKSGPERVKSLADEAGCKLPAAQAEKVKAAKTVDELVLALDKRVSPRTPRVIPAGAMFLQPGEERRRSGSHYTPRSLTEPIVRTTLKPVLEALGTSPSPEAVVALKVCDPAMGSGAFLVEACRALGDVLVASWQTHGLPGDLPEGEDPVLHARRLVAQRCLYGVDKNPFAVDLARLSLWLVTLAKDHPFTFLDHALRQGDSLVGLSREQIACLHWEVGKQVPLVRAAVEKAVREAEARRNEIHARAMADDVGEKRRLLDEAEKALGDARMLGDCVVAAFFDEEKDGARKKRVKALADEVLAWSAGTLGREALAGIARGLRERARPVTPFHWEIEFPEVFSRENPGFDAVVGNPPFMGGVRISEQHGGVYLNYLTVMAEHSSGQADLASFFLRRAFLVLRVNGATGLITTNTISQGETRVSGLRWICTHGGVVYSARKRLQWPGQASVIVSVVHVAKGYVASQRTLDGQTVVEINDFLLPGAMINEPKPLKQNERLAFQGCIILGQGFVFSPNPTGQENSIALMEELLAKNAANRELIFPYIGGEELNSDPHQRHRRYVLNFGERTEEEARQWPDLLDLARTRVWPERMTKDGKKYPRMVQQWWKFWNSRPELHATISPLPRVIVVARVSRTLAFAFLPAGTVFSEQLNVIALSTYSAFAVLQCRVHEVWARLFASSMKDDLRYSPSDCFETFPFPPGVLEDAGGGPGSEQSALVQKLEALGRDYYECRARIMADNNIGLTEVYSRFHDPEDKTEGMTDLRCLHDGMDRLVLNAYGWHDVAVSCAFQREEGMEQESESERTRNRRLSRYQWPDVARDAVLARLLTLNTSRS